MVGSHTVVPYFLTNIFNIAESNYRIKSSLVGENFFLLNEIESN